MNVKDAQKALDKALAAQRANDTPENAEAVAEAERALEKAQAEEAGE